MLEDYIDDSVDKGGFDPGPGAIVYQHITGVIPFKERKGVMNRTPAGRTAGNEKKTGPGAGFKKPGRDTVAGGKFPMFGMGRDAYYNHINSGTSGKSQGRLTENR